jgi:hypothetical protein
MLDNYVESVSTRLTQQKIKELYSAFESEGTWPISITAPTGVPDPRIAGVTNHNLSTGEMSQVTPDSLLAEMVDSTRLAVRSSKDVNDIFERARLLYVYGYSRWEFFTMSQHYAVLALEASLRELYDTWLGEDPVEVEARIGETCTKVMLSPNRECIYKWARRNDAHSVRIRGNYFPRQKSAYLDLFFDLGWLTAWERDRCKYLLELRDLFSHPTGAFIDWIGTCTRTLTDCAFMINLIWLHFSQSKT